MRSIHLAGADAEHIGLLNHRQERSVDAPSRLEQRREEAAHAQLRDLQLQASRACIEDPLAVAIAVRRSRRRSLVWAGADLRGCLGFDQPLHGVLEDASQHVRVCALELLEQCRGHHPVLGHRGSPGLGKSFQENSAVAFFVYLVGSPEVTPDLHHDKGHH
jgi:hypothetical protein